MTPTAPEGRALPNYEAEAKAYRKVDDEMGDRHPIPDLALRAIWRRDARAIRAENEIIERAALTTAAKEQPHE